MADELKACPFCGGVPGIAIYDGQYFMSCEDCGTCGNLFDSKSIAVKRWNTRPIEDAQAAEIERLNAALNEIENAKYEKYDESFDVLCRVRDIARAARKKREAANE